MKYENLTEEQKQRLLRWVSSGFNKCALRRNGASVSAPPHETWSQRRTRIRAYGGYFCRIIQGDRYLVMDEKPALRDDLQRLYEYDFPVVDLVEMMLTCTNTHSVRTDDITLYMNITHKKLTELRASMSDVANMIEAMDQPAVLSPLNHIGNILLRTKKQSRVRQLIGTLPADLRRFSQLVDVYCTEFEEGPLMRLSDFIAIWLYLLVKQCGGSYATVGRLLRALQSVHDAFQCESNGQGAIASRPESARESFSAGAIMKRLERFWGWAGEPQRFALEKQAEMYLLLPRYKKLRKSGKVIFDLLDELQRDWQAKLTSYMRAGKIPLGAYKYFARQTFRQT